MVAKRVKNYGCSGAYITLVVHLSEKIMAGWDITFTFSNPYGATLASTSGARSTFESLPSCYIS